MGAGQSTPPDPIPDPNLFINIGCVGLNATGYHGNRLSSAPFLSVNFQAANYGSMIKNILTVFQQIQPGWSPTPIEKDNTGDFDFNLDLKKNKKNNTSNESDESNGYTNTYTTPEGTSYTLKNGFNEQLDMEKRLKELGTYITNLYAQNQKENPNANISLEDIYSKNKNTAIMNGHPMSYWNSKHVYGPVYLLTAKDNSTNNLDCYLYFPSMTKDSRTWPNANFLGLAHNWMYLLLYGSSSRVQWCFTNEPFAGMATMPYYVGQNNNPCEIGTRVCTNMNRNHPNPCMNAYTKCKQTNNKMPYRDFHNFFGIYTGTAYYPELHTVADRFMYGCKPSYGNPYGCQQSIEAHKGMGLYDEYKSKSEYPVAYYHAYGLRLTDLDYSVYNNDITFADTINLTVENGRSRSVAMIYNGDSFIYKWPYIDQLNKIKSYVNLGPHSLHSLNDAINRGASCGLAQNILPFQTKLFQGCRTGLVSQNNRYYLVLSGRNLTLYYNYFDVNLATSCINSSFWGVGVIWNTLFTGGYHSYMIVEDNSINIYSATDANGTPLVVKSFQFSVPQDSSSPTQLTLILNDDGQLLVVNVKNETIANFNDLQGINANDDGKPFNKKADYARRLLNLKHYLILHKVYIDVQTSEPEKAPPDLKMPPFNSHNNYILRMYELLTYLVNNNKAEPNAAHNFRQTIINQTGSDINGLIFDNFNFTPRTLNRPTKTSTTSSINSSGTSGSGGLPSGSQYGVPPEPTSYAKSVSAQNRAERKALQAAEDDVSNNEANPNNPTCSINNNFSKQQTQQTQLQPDFYKPKNAAPSLVSLQDKTGTNSMFMKKSAKQTNINPNDITTARAELHETDYKRYMRERLESIKAYFEIQENINNLL